MIFGDADAEPLLGVTALESVGIVVPNFPFLYPLRYTPAPHIPSSPLSRRLGTILRFHRPVGLDRCWGR